MNLTRIQIVLGLHLLPRHNMLSSGNTQTLIHYIRFHIQPTVIPLNLKEIHTPNNISNALKDNQISEITNLKNFLKKSYPESSHFQKIPRHRDTVHRCSGHSLCTHLGISVCRRCLQRSPQSTHTCHPCSGPCHCSHQDM